VDSISSNQYNEYLARAKWSKSENLQQWVARRILSIFIKKTSSDVNRFNCLEIGSGIGRGGLAAKKLGFRSYTGVEPTTALREHCQSEFNFNVLDYSLPDLTGLNSESFDLCFSIHVLEHATSYADARLWVEEMLRVTKKGGYCLIAAPDINDYGSYFWDSDWSHGFPTSPRRVSQMLSDFDVDITYSGSMHLGSVSGLSAFCAHVIGFFIPTKLIDLLTLKLIKRPLASGVNFALLYGLTFVIVQKRSEKLFH